VGLHISNTSNASPETNDEAQRINSAGQITAPMPCGIFGSAGETRRNARQETVSAWDDGDECRATARSEAIQAAETALPARQEDDDDLPGAKNEDNASVGKTRRCRTCWRCENIRGHCWWVGRCAVDGRAVGFNSVCRYSRQSNAAGTQTYEQQKNLLVSMLVFKK
jgi:hypothetical protein